MVWRLYRRKARLPQDGPDLSCEVHGFLQPGGRGPTGGACAGSSGRARVGISIASSLCPITAAARAGPWWLISALGLCRQGSIQEQESRPNHGQHGDWGTSAKAVDEMRRTSWCQTDGRLNLEVEA